MLRLPTQHSAAEGPPSCSPHCCRPGPSDGAHALHTALPRRGLPRSFGLAARHQPLRALLRHPTGTACATHASGSSSSSGWRGGGSGGTQRGWQHQPLDRRKSGQPVASSRGGSSSAEPGEHGSDPVKGTDQRDEERQPEPYRQRPPNAADSASQQSDRDAPNPAVPSTPKVRSLFDAVLLTALPQPRAQGLNIKPHAAIHATSIHEHQVSFLAMIRRVRPTCSQ